MAVSQETKPNYGLAWCRSRKIKQTSVGRELRCAAEAALEVEEEGGLENVCVGDFLQDS
jgi:hypothetical protein